MKLHSALHVILLFLYTFQTVECVPDCRAVPEGAGQKSYPHAPWDVNVATRLMRYSRAVKCSYSDVAAWNCGADCFSGSKILAAFKDQKMDPDAFILNFDLNLNSLVLTIRSTHSDSDPNSFSKQWYTNFFFTPKTVTLGGTSYRLHAGMWDTWNNHLRSSAFKAIKKAIRTHPFGTHNGLYVVGHSRGGALATLAAIDFYLAADELSLNNPREQIKLITAGAPRVGETKFARMVEASLFNRFRIITNADVVTNLPPQAIQAVTESLNGAIPAWMPPNLRGIMGQVNAAIGALAEGTNDSQEKGKHIKHPLMRVIT